MPDRDARPIADQHDHDIADPQRELSECDLECVVGGLARPWTELDADEWVVKPAVPLL